MTEIQERLFRLQDTAYREFHSSLVPTGAKQTFIGVRVPALRTLAAELRREGKAEAFLRVLPHEYYEENALHALLLCGERDAERCFAELERFLPYVDNWAVCDSLNPKAFERDHALLREHIPGWLASERTYTIRFGIGMLLKHFLDEDFDPVCLDWVASLRSEEYYVRMMAAWYFAEALVKQYDAAVPFLKENRLERWTHNKAIQKAVESFRIPGERKEYLKSLRRKKER